MAGIPRKSPRTGQANRERLQYGRTKRRFSNGKWSERNGAHLLVKPRLRSLVTFNTMNLTKPVYIGRFDCIFCMDVLPHLSRAQRTALMERLHLYLEPGGYLFLSQTEKLSPQPELPPGNLRRLHLPPQTASRQRGLRKIRRPESCGDGRIRRPAGQSPAAVPLRVQS